MSKTTARQRHMPARSRPRRRKHRRKLVSLAGLLLLCVLSVLVLAQWRANRAASKAKSMLASAPASQPTASPLQLSKEYIYAGGKLIATEEPGTAATPTPTPSVTTAVAQFIATDTTSKGTWSGLYGADGYEIVNNAASYPSYAQAAVSGQSAYTWAASTSDVRALRKATNPADRIAATWYSPSSFTIDLNLTDGLAHRVALYCLDWDGSGARSQTIEILDAGSNQLLSSQNVTAFTEGKYLIWYIKGHVKIKATYTGQAGYSAVIGGIFFDSYNRTNVALAANGGVATASSTLDEGRSPIAVNNGDRIGLHWGSDPSTGSGWHDATPTYPDWLEIDFGGAQFIDQIDVYTIQDNYENPEKPTEAMTFTMYGVTDFQLQYWNGANWMDVPGANVTGNNKVVRRFTFPPVLTEKIRLVIHNSLNSTYPYSRIIEIRAWGLS